MIPSSCDVLGGRYTSGRLFRSRNMSSKSLPAIARRRASSSSRDACLGSVQPFRREYWVIVTPSIRGRPTETREMTRRGHAMSCGECRQKGAAFFWCSDRSLLHENADSSPANVGCPFADCTRSCQWMPIEDRRDELCASGAIGSRPWRRKLISAHPSISRDHSHP